MSTQATVMPEHLYAKARTGNGRQLGLEQHCADTEDAAYRLFGEGSRWGDAWMRFFKLAEAQRERFLLNLRVAALFHDLGKANEHFQGMVNRTRSERQTIRHEHLSALVLHLPVVNAWLKRDVRLDHDVITSAVLSHHTKAGPPTDEPAHRWCQPQESRFLRTFLVHPEVKAILQRLAEVTGLPEPPPLPVEAWGADPPWGPALRDGMLAARRFERALAGDEGRKRLLLATKAGVIVADSAASALVREGRTFDWITENATRPPLAEGEVETLVIAPRVAEIERQRRSPFVWQAFQKGVATRGDRVLLQAACGSGKTLAAWRWADAQAKARHVGRVVFLYPTRGTATEGFKDYVAWAPEADAALLHGTSAYELEDIARNPDETLASAGKRFALTQEDERLFALGYWPRRFFSATVDQFLGFMEHAYAGLCLLPVLADAAVIVDEVHSFDENMFNNLVAFLRFFDVPVLCMTATLPKDREERLREAGLASYPTSEDRTLLDDLRREEDAPRYSIWPLGEGREVEDEAVAAFERNERVLIVVNRVARCQEIAASLAERLPARAVLCYHSRFRLKDRKRRHDEVVRMFKQREEPAVAVVTQVCEMSLDLDADTLLTEHAPVTALVQRFGRANRNRHADGRTSSSRGVILHTAPEKEAPYRPADLASAREFLKVVEGNDVSQHRLATELRRFAPEEARPDGWARFLDSGYYAVPGSLRDGEEFTVSAVLDRDLDEVREALNARRPIDAWVVPALKGDARDPPADASWLPRWLRVAEAKHYTEERGYRKEVTL